MPQENPPTAVSDGRDQRGRFLPGNRVSKGNVLARKAATFRAKLFHAVSYDDFAEIVQRLLQEAKSGESWAVKLTLEYLIGQPRDIELEERLQKLETILENQK
jgi:hypothetical protein